MKYARIIDGVVDSISYHRPYFEGGPEPGWTEVPDGVFAGFSFDGESFTGPVPTPPPRQTVLKSLVQARIIEAGKMASAYATMTQKPGLFRPLVCSRSTRGLLRRTRTQSC
ncbi:MAG: hypothetical protein EOQ86_08745 [Mesorhizobium sp.]|uniref:hypothetical protein n=1 Tax=Mesorhizobium sp. TaxID=1871066 RepID=UPI000FE915E3|nr:hypothetical protein [Mesorhizobium sp.]RWH82074.1 MAG: hypothetical protein EOQ85_07130 [Mesorhizobium sp.]RWH85073.1 MAG: hypothetical protein EOQ86_08745 [Mesorhizobium sp.]RWH89829.1 MAG: hypothetical protein EOQ87_14810 [Mesorhizobium sp.]RWH98422.1 MAG: hypothetical protein EOQ88_14370 [Mesorhizobium sp.]RWI04570.1 MAG: hypothetical protein EOQ89_08190 [Mesorhizobium sp.]